LSELDEYFRLKSIPDPVCLPVAQLIISLHCSVLMNLVSL
jgi:hypothetical protein